MQGVPEQSSGVSDSRDYLTIWSPTPSAADTKPLAAAVPERCRARRRVVTMMMMMMGADGRAGVDFVFEDSIVLKGHREYDTICIWRSDDMTCSRVRIECWQCSSVSSRQS